MTGGLVPDLVGYRVGPIAEPGDRLGERQCGPFGLREVGMITAGSSSGGQGCHDDVLLGHVGPVWPV